MTLARRALRDAEACLALEPGGARGHARKGRALHLLEQVRISGPFFGRCRGVEGEVLDGSILGPACVPLSFAPPRRWCALAPGLFPRHPPAPTRSLFLNPRLLLFLLPRRSRAVRGGRGGLPPRAGCGARAQGACRGAGSGHFLALFPRAGLFQNEQALPFLGGGLPSLPPSRTFASLPEPARFALPPPCPFFPHCRRSGA